nr:integrase, catalytic region, zinc finger, CCHC-type, peptidase aspartic, catalytic [Tanacetum cinerariifolium]
VAFCPGLRFVLDCVVSSTAFSLFEDHLLHFDKDKLCQNQNCIAFCISLRFAIEDLAFCQRRFLRFAIQDTAFCLEPNGEALRKCILSGSYKPTTVLVHVVEATDNSLAVPEHTTVKTPSNMSLENKAHFLAEKEAIHLILTGIRDDIYSTVDAFQTTQEIWEAIERLQQGESLNIQDVKTNLFWKFGKFTSHDGESMESYYTSFYKLINEMIRNNLTVTTMHVNVQFLQQLQPEWSRNANPLALVATAQASQDSFYQSSRKEIAKPITPPSETASEDDNDPEQAQRDKDMQKNLALIAKYFKKIYKPTHNNLRTSSNSKNKNMDTTPRYKNDDHSGQFGIQKTVNIAGTREKECKKPKRVKDSAYHKEKMLLYKQAEQGVPLQVEQYDRLSDTDEEVDEQELEAHYSYMAKIQEDDIQNEQNDVECEDERKPTPFSDSLERRYFSKTTSVPKTNVSEGLSKPVTAQTLLQAAKKAVSNTNVLRPGMYRIDNRTTYTRAPQLPQSVRNTNLRFAPIFGYGDLVQGNVTINRVHYVEGLNHNLFSVGQFCDAELEVAFRKSTCFVKDLRGNDLLTGNHGSDLYTISLQESTSSTPLCLMVKATPTQAWLWHQILSHL